MPLGSSRLDTTRTTCRARRDKRVEHTQILFVYVSCWGVPWRAKWNLGL